MVTSFESTIVYQTTMALGAKLIYRIQDMSYTSGWLVCRFLAVLIDVPLRREACR